MKRRFMSLFIVFMMVFAFPTGYPNANPATNSAVAPFSFDYEIDENTERFFLENDEFETLLFGSPFYGGREVLPIPEAVQFQTVRENKVGEIIALAKKIMETAHILSHGLDSAIEDLFSYLSIIAESDSELEEFDEVIASEITLILARREIAEAQYFTFMEEEIDEAIIKSLFDYIGAIIAMGVAGNYIELFDTVGLYAGYCISLFEDHPSEVIREAGKVLDEQMLALNDMVDYVDILLESVESMGYGFMQLAAGDHYMALASVQFIEDSIPELTVLVEGLTPGEVLTLEDIEFIAEYLDYYGEYAAILRGKLLEDYIEDFSLVSMGHPTEKSGTGNSGWGVAKAALASHYSHAIASLEEPAETEVSRGFFGRGWDALKSGGTSIANGVGTAVTTVGKTLRTGAGVIVETADATAYGMVRIGTGIYYGNTSLEIAGECFERLDTAVNRMIDDEMGADVYKTAGQYLEIAEDYAAEIPTAIPGGIFATLGIAAGELTGYDSYLTRGLDSMFEWSTWATRGVSKTTAGFFTGLGKGIYKVANPKSTTGEIVSGAVEIGLALIGGSKIMGTASQALELGGKKGITVAKQGLDFISRALPGKASHFLSHIGNAATSKASAALNKVAPGLAHKLSGLLGEGAKKPLMQASKEYATHILGQAGSSLKGLFLESYRGLPGLKKGLLEVFGKSFTEYSNNLAGAWLDEYLGKKIAGGVEWLLGDHQEDSGAFPDDLLGEWIGTWSAIDGEGKVSSTSAVTSFLMEQSDEGGIILQGPWGWNTFSVSYEGGILNVMSKEGLTHNQLVPQVSGDMPWESGAAINIGGENPPAALVDSSTGQPMIVRAGIFNIGEEEEEYVIEGYIGVSWPLRQLVRAAERVDSKYPSQEEKLGIRWVWWIEHELIWEVDSKGRQTRIIDIAFSYEAVPDEYQDAEIVYEFKYTGTSTSFPSHYFKLSMRK